jgi:hypothetical protein
MMTKNVFRHPAVIVNYWPTGGKLAAQLAAKKKQSINSGCVAPVLRLHRK